MQSFSIGLRATTELFKKLGMSYGLMGPYVSPGESNVSWQFNARKNTRNKKTRETRAISVPSGSTVEPAYMVHGCKVNPLVWSIFVWPTQHS